MGELRQDVGAGWFSDPRTTRTVDEGRHNATAITAREDPLIVTLRLVIGKQSACRWGYRNHRISSWTDLGEQSDPAQTHFAW